MRFIQFSTLCVVLSLAAGAQGQMTLHSGGIFDWILTPVGPVGTSGQLHAAVISIVNNTGNPANNPQAYDGKASAFNGVHGVLHQQWGPGTPTPDDTIIWASTIDSHYLINGVPFAFDSGTGAPEENMLSGSIELPDQPLGVTGFGHFLKMTGTRTGTVPDIWDLVYVVVPEGGRVAVEAQVANTLGQKDGVAMFEALQRGAEWIIPAPAAGPMGAVGLLLAARRRRR